MVNWASRSAAATDVTAFSSAESPSHNVGSVYRIFTEEGNKAALAYRRDNEMSAGNINVNTGLDMGDVPGPVTVALPEPVDFAAIATSEILLAAKNHAKTQLTAFIAKQIPVGASRVAGLIVDYADTFYAQTVAVNTQPLPPRPRVSASEMSMADIVADIQSDEQNITNALNLDKAAVTQLRRAAAKAKAGIWTSILASVAAVIHPASAPIAAALAENLLNADVSPTT